MKINNTVILCLVLLLLSVQSIAQKVRFAQQEYGAGITVGYGKPNSFADNTIALGLQGSYQYNLAWWFSLKGSLGYLYTLPSKRDMLNENGETIGDVANTCNVLYLGVSPLLYGRFRKASVFVGATASIGQAWLVTKFNTQNPPENTVITKPTFGIWPQLGVSFKLKDSPKTSSNLEFVLTQIRFNNQDTFTLSNTAPVLEYRVFALQINYKYLF